MYVLWYREAVDFPDLKALRVIQEQTEIQEFLAKRECRYISVSPLHASEHGHVAVCYIIINARGRVA